jgi:hypothetical protein
MFKRHDILINSFKRNKSWKCQYICLLTMNCFCTGKEENEIFHSFYLSRKWFLTALLRIQHFHSSCLRSIHTKQETNTYIIFLDTCHHLLWLPLLELPAFIHIIGFNVRRAATITLFRLKFYTSKFTFTPVNWSVEKCRLQLMCLKISQDICELNGFIKCFRSKCFTNNLQPYSSVQTMC